MHDRGFHSENLRLDTAYLLTSERKKGGRMTEQLITALDRRRFLIQVMPACSLACLCAGGSGADDEAEPNKASSPEQHKFEVEFEQKTSVLKQTTEQNRNYIDFIKTLQSELEEEDLIRLLKIHSADWGRRIGERHAASAPDTSFKSFVANFRPPRYKNNLTLEITEDTPKVFELRVTECVWAKVFREAGLGGEIGHAAFCNMDYHWPPAFNENFKMERSKTLMQGDDHCNHRYIDTA
jgi:hypothetical protein